MQMIISFFLWHKDSGTLYLTFPIFASSLYFSKYISVIIRVVRNRKEEYFFTIALTELGIRCAKKFYYLTILINRLTISHFTINIASSRDL